LSWAFGENDGRVARPVRTVEDSAISSGASPQEGISMNEIDSGTPTPDGQECNIRHSGCQLVNTDAAALPQLGGRTVVDALADALARIEKLEASV
jgi:hypothetical protein